MPLNQDPRQTRIGITNSLHAASNATPRTNASDVTQTIIQHMLPTASIQVIDRSIQCIL